MEEGRRAAEHRRLAIAAGLDVVVLNDNEILVQHGTGSRPSELHRDADLTDQLGPLFARLLLEPATIAQLLDPVPSEHRAEFARVITDFVERGVLGEADREPLDQYFSYTFEGDVSLVDRSVFVLGAGPLGAPIASSLLAHGVGTIRLADDRPISDFWKHSVGLPDAEGGTASEELARSLSAVRSASVETIAGPLDGFEVESALTETDLTIVAFERPSVHVSQCVNRWALRARRPWLLTTVDGHNGLVGPLFVPFETACYQDLWTLHFAASGSPAVARRFYRHLAAKQTDGFFGGPPSYTAILGGFTALAAVHFLLTGTAFAVGRVITINFDSMVIDTEDVLRLPRCPTCGGPETAYRPLFLPEIAELATAESLNTQRADTD